MLHSVLCLCQRRCSSIKNTRLFPQGQSFSLYIVTLLFRMTQLPGNVTSGKSSQYSFSPPQKDFWLHNRIRSRGTAVFKPVETIAEMSLGAQTIQQPTRHSIIDPGLETHTQPFISTGGCISVLKVIIIHNKQQQQLWLFCIKAVLVFL